MAVRKKTDQAPVDILSDEVGSKPKAKPAPKTAKATTAKKAPAKDKSAVAVKATVKKAPAKKTGSASTTKKAAGTKKTAASATKATRTSSPRARSADGRSLVVVESPAKAKTLQKYLGANYLIEASVGHVMDLPPTKIGVDIEGGFEPEYMVLKGKEKVMERLREMASTASEIFLAPDPDREGEAIAWHIQSYLREGGVEAPIHRATFNEITKRAVEAGIQNPRVIDQHLFEAQQARRILDRLVGYKISPLLWAKVTRGLSAGRVQSVAVRLVVEREREIEAFVPVEYWSLEASGKMGASEVLLRLAEADGEKPAISDQKSAEVLLKRTGVAKWTVSKEAASTRAPERVGLKGGLGALWKVSQVEKKDVKRRPAAPFITSTLQQEASRKLGFGTQRTMSLAQKLYEGVEMGSLGQVALITYMRTDSTRIGPEALTAVREHIDRQYGNDYLPEKARVFSAKKDAQDAHEAVRPVDMALTPENVSRYLEADMLKLYTLIWNRFVASQMADALFEATRVEVRPVDGLLYVATGQVQKFAGFLAVYEEGKDDEEDEENRRLPAMKAGDEIQMTTGQADQHFTQPPPRYSEATLVKELEKQGIGRPSTYASIVSTIQDKKYVEKDDGRRLRPTETGNVVTDLLKESFPDIMDLKFTAQMELRLDEVESGDQDWRLVLGEFWEGFSKRLETASKSMREVKREATETDIQCELCNQANMVIKWGRNGRFLACPRYPECRNTREVGTLAGSVPPPEATDEKCDLCGRPMVIKTGRTGRFLACTGYPDCKGIKSFKIGVKCPKCLTGDLGERVSKKGRMFFSCSNYSATPSCDFVEWSRPVPKACPACANTYMVSKDSSRRRALMCTKCKHLEIIEELEGAEAVG